MSLPGLIVRQGERGREDHFTNVEDFKTSTQTLLHRLDLLERRQAKVGHLLSQCNEIVGIIIYFWKCRKMQNKQLQDIH